MIEELPPGSGSHEEFLQECLHNFRAMGYEFHEDEQHPYSSHVTVGNRPDGGRVWVLLVPPTLYKPGTVHESIALGSLIDVDVIVVAESRCAANNVAKTLRDPWRRIASEGCVLHTTSATVNTNDNHVPVVSSEARSIEWIVTPSEMLQLHVDGSVVAEGPIDERIATFDFQCPTYREDAANDEHIVEGESVGVQTRYETRDNLYADWAPVRAPYCPPSHLSPGPESIWYRAIDTVVKLDTEPTWTTEHTVEGHYNAADIFRARYLIEQPGSRIGTDELIDAFRRFFSARSTSRILSRPWSGRILGNQYDDFTFRDGLADYTWVYPPALDSPNCPSIDGERFDFLEGDE